jgi:hypothetical protein
VRIEERFDWRRADGGGKEAVGASGASESRLEGVSSSRWYWARSKEESDDGLEESGLA